MGWLRNLLCVLGCHSWRYHYPVGLGIGPGIYTRWCKRDGCGELQTDIEDM